MLFASAGSRYDRRDGSELSSSEDDDYDYVKSRRSEASTDTSASKLKNHRNGSDSTSVPAFQRQTSNNNSIHTRITRPDRYHNNQPLPQKSSTNSNLTNNTTIVTKSSDQDLIDGATMERRRQKFQAGMEVIPDERTKVKVSLASLKSNNPLSSAAITYQETESMYTESKFWEYVVLFGSLFCATDSSDVGCLFIRSSLFICRDCYRLTIRPSGRHSHAACRTCSPKHKYDTDRITHLDADLLLMCHTGKKRSMLKPLEICSWFGPLLFLELGGDETSGTYRQRVDRLSYGT